MARINAFPNGELDIMISLVERAEPVGVKPAEGRHCPLRKAIS